MEMRSVVREAVSVFCGAFCVNALDIKSRRQTKRAVRIRGRKIVTTWPINAQAPAQVTNIGMNGSWAECERPLDREGAFVPVSGH